MLASYHDPYTKAVEEIKKNNVDGILREFNRNAYDEHSVAAWHIAFEYPIPDNPYHPSSAHHALDIFILLNLKNMPIMNVINYLNTKEGRDSMTQTIIPFLKKEPQHAKVILEALDDKKSILYRGLHSHRDTVRVPFVDPTCMRIVKAACIKAKDVYEKNVQVKVAEIKYATGKMSSV